MEKKLADYNIKLNYHTPSYKESGIYPSFSTLYIYHTIKLQKAGKEKKTLL